jgi:hypothetical protein
LILSSKDLEEQPLLSGPSATTFSRATQLEL